MFRHTKYLQNIYFRLKTSHKRFCFRIFDYFSFFLVSYLALSLRFDIFTSLLYLENHIVFVACSFAVKVISFELFRIYDNVLRFLYKNYIVNLLKANAVIASVFIAVVIGNSYFKIENFIYPRSVLVIEVFLLFLFTLGWRYICRKILLLILEGGTNIRKENIALCATGIEQESYLNFLSDVHSITIQTILDNNKEFIGRIIQGARVFSLEKFQKYIKDNRVNFVFIPLPYNEEKLKWIEFIRKNDIKIRKLPSLLDLKNLTTNKEATISKVDVVDLLHRKEILPLHNIIDKELNDKVIVVTGAGGSIGRELCLQIVKRSVKKLLLIENNEFALYKIYQFLKDNNYSNIVPLLCSISNEKSLLSIFRQHKPDVVYHAAAYKHVTLVEENPLSAVFNNVIGTLLLTKACLQNKVSKMILVSTDKAVNPINIMGKTKRAAELILQAISTNSTQQTKFVIVRFGNVMDSDGSVIPRFRQQIEKRKSVTVSDPHVKRYFMSISEACSLIIQAGGLGNSGNILMLDMGEQVSILQVAKDMIELSGLKLGKDITIKFTGLQPNEKLEEELYLDNYNLLKTQHEKIHIIENEVFVPFAVLSDELSRLYLEVKQEFTETAIETLNRIISHQQITQRNSKIGNL